MSDEFGGELPPEAIIDNLCLELLDFETEELKNLRESAKETETEEQAAESVNRYQELGYKLPQTDKLSTGIQFGSALIFRKTRPYQARLCVEDAWESAEVYGLTDIARQLKAVLNAWRKEQGLDE